MLGPKVSVKLQKPTETISADGSIQQSWSDVYTFNAVVIPLKPEEKRAFDKETVYATYRLMASYSLLKDNVGEVKEKNRIKVGSSDYDIVGVTNYHNRHFELDLLEIK